MKLLESSAHRYDRGIQILTGGKLGKLFEILIKEIHKGDKILDIGCGTGNLSIVIASKGADVKGIDINTEMLKIAKSKLEDLDVVGNVEFIEMGVAELDSELEGIYDCVTASLSLSELSEDEIKYALEQSWRILKDGGKLLVIDEVVPQSLMRKVIYYIHRTFLVFITYILTQTTTRPLRNIDEHLEVIGYKIMRDEVYGNTRLFVAEKGVAM